MIIPQDFYFRIINNKIRIVNKEFWNKHRTISYSMFCDEYPNINELLESEGFWNVVTHGYNFEHSHDNDWIATDKLLKIGMEYNEQI